MFIQRLSMPMRYKPGTALDTTGVLFYQDGTCMQLGRTIQVVPGLTKEKLCSVTPNRVTEWVTFRHNGRNYVTSMRVYTRYEDSMHKQQIRSDKFLFTKAIENLLNDSQMCKNDGLMSAQMFRLENAISRNPELVDPEEEIFYQFDRCAYVETMVERLLLSQNDHPIMPIYHDLIFKKDVGAEVLADENNYLVYTNPITDAVFDLTVPIKSYLASSPIVEREIVGSLSPFKYQPNLLQMMSQRVNEDLTLFTQFKCPFSEKDLNEDICANDTIYSLVSTIDEFPFDAFCVSYNALTDTSRFIYKVNTHFGTDGMVKVPKLMHDSIKLLKKWFNEPCNKIDICRTPTEEIFINIHTTTGHDVKFYVDISLFDLAAHNLIDQ